MLKSFQGTTKDFHGCEFHYTCNKVVDYGYDKDDKFGLQTLEQTYVCKENPRFQGKTLKELKEKVSNFGRIKWKQIGQLKKEKFQII